ncbi:hypothetical protein NSZ01_06270 [Nocardioides szechwanensis]|nr:hypothetical protein NSZ01_06270 [Nocardioides szechwanensis]
MNRESGDEGSPKTMPTSRIVAARVAQAKESCSSAKVRGAKPAGPPRDEVPSNVRASAATSSVQGSAATRPNPPIETRPARRPSAR